MNGRELGIIVGGVIWCGLFPTLAGWAVGLFPGNAWWVNAVFGVGGIAGFLLFAGVGGWMGGKTR